MYPAVVGRMALHALYEACPMPREYKSNEHRPESAVSTAEASAASTPVQTQFRTTGPIPPVHTAAMVAEPSASDRAFGQAATPGAGTQDSSSAFSRAMGFILPHEEVFAPGHDGDERYVVPEHVKGDSGGTTKYGIDQASHKDADVEHLTREQAIAIYQQEWDRMQLDGLPDQVAMTLFDVRVNGGDPVRWLQNAINQLQPAGAPQVTADGKLGAATIEAANAMDPTAIVHSVIAQREQYYSSLTKNNPNKFGQFSQGWHNRNRDLTAYVARPESQQALAPVAPSPTTEHHERHHRHKRP